MHSALTTIETSLPIRPEVIDVQILKSLRLIIPVILKHAIVCLLAGFVPTLQIASNSTVFVIPCMVRSFEKSYIIHTFNICSDIVEDSFRNVQLQVYRTDRQYTYPVG